MDLGWSPSSRRDLWLAFAAGPEAWEEEADRIGSDLGRPIRLLQMTCFAVAGTWPVVWTVAVAAAPGTDAVSRREAVTMAILLLSVAFLLAVPYSRTVRRWSDGRSWVWAAVRAPLSWLMMAMVVALAPDPALLGVWPIGVAAGCDAARTAWVLDLDLRPGHWLRKVLLSTAHLGLVIGFVWAAVIFGWSTAGTRIAWLYAAVLLVLGTAALTVRVLAGVHAAAQERRAAAEAAVVAREHRRRGHWLHDDVCSELRLLRLRVENGQVAGDHVARELYELDHRLRLRQLDEFIEAGSVRLAEVVQPFLRRAQQHGVVIAESPSLETAGLVLGAAPARLVERALSVLTTNALQAGTPTLSVRLAVDDGAGVVEVEVEDDAGGFDVDRILPGRGIDGLCHELGRARVSLVPTVGGTLARAVIPLRPTAAQATDDAPTGASTTNGAR